LNGDCLGFYKVLILRLCSHLHLRMLSLDWARISLTGQ
jgi:hypothetical protein